MKYLCSVSMILLAAWVFALAEQLCQNDKFGWTMFFGGALVISLLGFGCTMVKAKEEEEEEAEEEEQLPEV